MFHVKPTTTPDAPSEPQILEALTAIGLNPTTAQCEKLALHATWVLTANREINLTRITQQDDFLRLHIVDSLLPLRFFDLSEGTLLDVGSGAGFPGIPLAIMGCSVSLCETRKKKAAYLAQWCSSLGLAVPVLDVRAEEIARMDSWDWVVMRAVSSLASLIELSRPLVSAGGALVAMKGVCSSEEERDAKMAAGQVGMSLERRVEYSLPHGDERRTLYEYRVSGPSRIALPRRPGAAQTQPLV